MKAQVVGSWAYLEDGTRIPVSEYHARVAAEVAEQRKSGALQRIDWDSKKRISPEGKRGILLLQAIDSVLTGMYKRLRSLEEKRDLNNGLFNVVSNLEKARDLIIERGATETFCCPKDCENLEQARHYVLNHRDKVKQFLKEEEVR